MPDLSGMHAKLSQKIPPDAVGSGIEAVRNWLPTQRFAQLVADAPLVSLDFVVLQGVGESQRLLLGFRNNRPAKGFWFVPGGRIHKGEALQAAIARTLEAELGMPLDAMLSNGAELAWLGVYQHFYEDSFADANVPTHYVVLAHVLYLPEGLVLPLPKGKQHEQWRWWSVDQALINNAVHTHTRDYMCNGRAVLGGRG